MATCSGVHVVGYLRTGRVDRPELSSKQLLELTDRGGEKVIQRFETQGLEAISDGYPQLVLIIYFFLFKESRYLKPVHVLPAHTLAVRAVIVPNRKRRAT